MTADMAALIATDRAAGVGGLELARRPRPHLAENDVLVRVHAAGFTPGELDWPGTWTDRAGRDRAPSVPGHELSGVVVELGYGTTGLTVGQRVFGVSDWCRDGTLAEYVAVEARNLAALPAGVEHTAAAALPISGLTAWQGLFDHGRLRAGQTVLINGAAGAVGSMAVQLARWAGAVVVGTGRAGRRDDVLALGADEFVATDGPTDAELPAADVVFDVLGGEVGGRAARAVRPGGTLVTIAGPPDSGPRDGRAVSLRAVFFVVEPDRDALSRLVALVRDGSLRVPAGPVVPLADAAEAFASRGKPIVVCAG